MRLPKRGERGFTLIELLIVVAILGVLAAVVIPNVTRFVGAGEQEAAETELHNIQLAVTSMMLENGITTIPNALNADLPVPVNNHRNDMHLFPDILTPAADKGYTAARDGYVIYDHDLVTASDNFTTVNYVTVQITTYHYTCEADGTVQQWDPDGNLLVWD